jgi:hypothetical protein
MASFCLLEIVSFFSFIYALVARWRDCPLKFLSATIHRDKRKPWQMSWVLLDRWSWKSKYTGIACSCVFWPCIQKRGATGNCHSWWCALAIGFIGGRSFVSLPNQLGIIFVSGHAKYWN